MELIPHYIDEVNINMIKTVKLTYQGINQYAVNFEPDKKKAHSGATRRCNIL